MPWLIGRRKNETAPSTDTVGEISFFLGNEASKVGYINHSHYQIDRYFGIRFWLYRGLFLDSRKCPLARVFAKTTSIA
jgi:hypothetical protein